MGICVLMVRVSGSSVDGDVGKAEPNQHRNHESCKSGDGNKHTTEEKLIR